HAGIGHHHLCTVRAGNCRRAQTNWPRPYHQQLIALADGCTSYSMSADGERFDQRRGLRIDAISRQQVRHRHHQILSKTTVLMHANHRDILAAVGAPAAAGRTFAAGNIGYHRYLLAIFQILDIFTEANNLAAYFMAQHAGIAKIRLMATPGMDIRAANTDGFYFNQRLIIPWQRYFTYFPD